MRFSAVLLMRLSTSSEISLAFSSAPLPLRRQSLPIGFGITSAKNRNQMVKFFKFMPLRKGRTVPAFSDS